MGWSPPSSIPVWQGEALASQTSASIQVSRIYNKNKTMMNAIGISLKSHVKNPYTLR